MVLGAWLQYTSYMPLFNVLAASILLFVLASTSISVAGMIRERFRRYRYLILMLVNVLFFIWVQLE
jgi:hypothetical protein